MMIFALKSSDFADKFEAFTVKNIYFEERSNSRKPSLLLLEHRGLKLEEKHN